MLVARYWKFSARLWLPVLLSICQTICLAQTQLPSSPPEWIQVHSPNLFGHTDRPLRYWPDGTDFVITNGVEFFNRPLYCANSAFRVDGGDKPEFSLYVPGRGGNLRFGIKTSAGAKWLNDPERIITTYRPGSLIYEISDPLLANPTRMLRLTVVPLSGKRGIIARADLTNAAWPPVELFWAFGGANGMRGSRGGDIGCERESVSEFFQLQPEQCRGNEFTLASNTFVLHSRVATIEGVVSGGATHAIADANLWADPNRLLASAGATNDLPLVVGRISLNGVTPVFFAFRQISDRDETSLSADALPELFSAAEAHRQELATRVVVETPDPFINAAAAALNVAGDAIWDEAQGAYMHGAVAWRNKLLGWRGPYVADALGWHDRARRHLTYWAGQQITNPIPDKIPPADPASNLSRNEAALHSNGALSKSHYDMNLVYIDALFRHLLWTGDLEFARQVWPVIERHIAWERRLFRREFGPDKLPLYEGYAAIWASDDMEYEGGGTAHASAYNYYHNKMAARVARLIGRNPEPYEREAELIANAMRKYLWLDDTGCFAEWKDYLGLQLVHPNAGLWTFYHTIDSEVPTRFEAWQMTRFVDTQIAHIPIHGPGVPEGNYFTLPTTSWMPYTWSLNNVVMAEAAHTALAYWEAGRNETAFRLFKGCELDSMFMGLCPGNVGAMTGFDMARREAQRDFADGIGVCARTEIEGLFGVHPDALAGELRIEPGFPAEWQHARIHHPDFDFAFRRDNLTETFSIQQRFAKPMSLRLQVRAIRDRVSRVTVNGKPAKWSVLTNSIGWPRIEIGSPAGTNFEVAMSWTGNRPGASEDTGTAVGDRTTFTKVKQGQLEWWRPIPAPNHKPEANIAGQITNWNAKLPATTRFDTINLSALFNDKVTQIFRNEYLTPRSPFCSLAIPKQGIGSWCNFNEQFNVDDSGLRAAAEQSGGKFILPNGVPFETATNSDAKNVIFTSQWNNYPRAASVPLNGRTRHAYFLVVGSTNPMQSRFDNGEIIVTYADGSTARLPLRNPTNWWPIDQDYFIDDYAFRRPEPIPPRVDLKTGAVRILNPETFKGRGGKVPGGAATVLDLPLDAAKELKSVSVRTLANEVVVGLMAVTLER